jgi:hypothetical protein
MPTVPAESKKGGGGREFPKKWKPTAGDCLALIIYLDQHFFRSNQVSKLSFTSGGEFFHHFSKSPNSKKPLYALHCIVGCLHPQFSNKNTFYSYHKIIDILWVHDRRRLFERQNNEISVLLENLLFSYQNTLIKGCYSENVY